LREGFTWSCIDKSFRVMDPVANPTVRPHVIPPDSSPAFSTG
jgi:hypothetical protein